MAVFLWVWMNALRRACQASAKAAIIQTAREPRRLVHLEPATGMRAHVGSFAIEPDLLFVRLRRNRRGDIECNVERLPDMSLFDRKLPGQEYLEPVLVRREVG